MNGIVWMSRNSVICEEEGNNIEDKGVIWMRERD